MCKIILILTLLATTGSVSKAESVSNDFGKYSGDLKPIKPQELRSRVQVNGDIYVVDAKGNTVFFRGPESRQWRFSEKGKIESNWSAIIADYPEIALKHTWTVGEDGTLRVKIQQYDSMRQNPDNNRDVQYGKVIKEEEIVAKDFGPVLWTAFSTDKYRLVVRFIPTIRDIDENHKKISDFPIAGSHVLISDNQGHTWIEPMDDLNSRYVVFVTHLGELALSYNDFPGSKFVGTAKENTIEMEIAKGVKVRLTSGTPFLPGDMSVDVYGYYNPNKKSSRLSSTHVMTTDKESRLLEFLGLKRQAETKGSELPNKKVSFKIMAMGIREAFDALFSQENIKFTLADNVSNDDKVSMDVKDVEWSEALSFLLEEGHLKSEITKDGAIAIHK